ncbi:MAG TPA: SMI1/KNR4 family protein [Thermoanaerobaculia bacterium]|nr:SMI1/KNR4 family protein [Thermoanaerobaculia bacterium]
MDIVLGLLTVGLVAAGLAAMIRHRFTMRRLMRRAAAASSAAPKPLVADIEGLELFYGRPVPSDIAWLYNEAELLRERNMVRFSNIAPAESYSIDHFLPATVETVSRVSFEIGSDFMPFGVDEADNYLAVRVGDRSDSRVYYIDHEQSASWVIATSLREFLAPPAP